MIRRLDSLLDPYIAGATMVVAVVVVAPRSSVVILAAMAGYLFFRSMKANDTSSRLLGKSRSSISILMLVFVIYLFTSQFWSSADIEILEALKPVLLFFLGWFLINLRMNLPIGKFESVRRGVIAGFFLATAIIAAAAIYALGTGDSLWGAYYFDPTTTLNSSAVVLALFIWPVTFLAVLWFREKAAFLLLPIPVLLFFLSSDAASVSLLIGGLAMSCRKFGGVRLGIAMAAIIAVAVVATPSLIHIGGIEQADFSEQAKGGDKGLPSSVAHRLAMWSFAAEKIDEKPLLGWGFNASRNIPQEDRRLAPNMEIMPLHPHNLALQTRLELGLPGAFILAGLVFAVFYRVATFTDDGWKSGVAMAAATSWLFIANVSYGMWQSWWIATAFLLALLVKVSFEAQPPKPR